MRIIDHSYNINSFFIKNCLKFRFDTVCGAKTPKLIGKANEPLEMDDIERTGCKGRRMLVCSFYLADPEGNLLETGSTNET